MSKKLYIDKEIVNDNEYAHSDIEEVVISKNVKYLGNRAFFYCEKIKSVIFEGESIELGYECFSICESLKSIKLPRMTHIPYRCFYYSGLKEIQFPSNLIGIDAQAFGLCHFSHLEFPDSLKTIGSYAFSQSGKVETLDFKNVEVLGCGAFRMFHIKSMKIGGRIIHIPPYCFDYSDLENVEVKPAILHGTTKESDSEYITLDHHSFSNNYKLNIKLPKNFFLKNTTFWINEHPWYLVYIKEAYKNLHIFVPEECGLKEYKTFDNHVIPVEKYKREKRDTQ